MAPIIETDKLSKSYGPFRGIVDVDLTVNEGEIFGFLGPNGAGKTTTIRILLDLIRPTSGSAHVFGIESSADPVAIHRRVGYLPGEWNLYDRLSGAETITILRQPPRWRRPSLRRPARPAARSRPVAPLSRILRGNKQKVGLIFALQHRPELLILDEPTAGLDPLVQQVFNELLFEARSEGRTIFLSSHIISEVERTCDRVAIIREGRIVRLDTVEGVRALAAHEVELPFAAPVPAAAFAALDGVSNVVEEGRNLRMLVTGPIATVVQLAAQYEVIDLVSREPSLEEVFLSEYATRRAGTPAGVQ